MITYNSDATKAERRARRSGDGDGHLAVQASVTDSQRLAELVETVGEGFGRINLLVNNAGITTPVPHADLDALTDDWIDRIMQTNVRGTFAMIRAFAPMLRQSGGTVVNISSIAGITGVGSNVAYCASKAAIDSMTRSLGRALAPDVRVVSVSPGWVLGDYASRFDPEYIQMQKDQTPLKDLARPEDVAEAVYAAHAMLTFTTGNIITVDGGRTLGV